MGSWGHWICSRAHPLEGPCVLPLCARCTGLYVAMALGLLTLAALKRRPLTGMPLVFSLALIAVAPLHVFTTGDAAGDLARFAAGALSGSGLAILLGAHPVLSPVLALLLVGAAATRSYAVHAVLALFTPIALAADVIFPLSLIVRSVRRSRIAPERS